MKVRGVKLYIEPYSCFIFFIILAKLSFVHMEPVLGIWQSFWYGFALLNSPSDGLFKSEIICAENLPLTFPENVPVVLIVDLGVPFNETHFLKHFLDDGRDIPLGFVDELVHIVSIIVPLLIVLQLQRRGS
jgi:hypothetical protein